jgi:hypothetical protein
MINTMLHFAEFFLFPQQKALIFSPLRKRGLGNQHSGIKEYRGSLFKALPNLRVYLQKTRMLSYSNNITMLN